MIILTLVSYQESAKKVTKLNFRQNPHAQVNRLVS